MSAARVYIHPSMSAPMHGVGDHNQVVRRATLLFELREAGYTERDVVRGKRYGWEVALHEHRKVS